MRFTTAFAAAAVAMSTVRAEATTVSLDITSILGFDVSNTNNFGAPSPPWNHGSQPGWYYGSHPELHLHQPYPCLLGWICNLLDLIPWVIHCPKPPHNPPPPPTSDGYTQTFSNLTGATQADGYLTFGLVDTVANCKAMCNSVNGCKFANSYHDVNGKDGSTQLTCSLFSSCHNATDADNYGGQTQPDGSVDYIINSDGWCKN